MMWHAPQHLCHVQALQPGPSALRQSPEAARTWCPGQCAALQHHPRPLKGPVKTHRARPCGSHCVLGRTRAGRTKRSGGTHANTIKLLTHLDCGRACKRGQGRSGAQMGCKI